MKLIYFSFHVTCYHLLDSLISSVEIQRKVSVSMESFTMKMKTAAIHLVLFILTQNEKQNNVQKDRFLKSNEKLLNRRHSVLLRWLSCSDLNYFNSSYSRSFHLTQFHITLTVLPPCAPIKDTKPHLGINVFSSIA